MTGRENKAISPAGRTSARRSMNESKRTANSQELVGSPSKRRETRALIPSLSSRFCSPDFPSLKKRGQCDDMSRSQKKRKPNQQSDVISDALSEISLPPPTSDRVRSSSLPRELREIYRYHGAATCRDILAAPGYPRYPGAKPPISTRYLVYAVIIAFLGAPEFLLPPPPKFAGKASTPPATAIAAITLPFY
jgi:hypothetical protein